MLLCDSHMTMVEGIDVHVTMPPRSTRSIPT